MSKGSATALILIALALAGIAAGGYVAITGAAIPPGPGPGPPPGICTGTHRTCSTYSSEGSINCTSHDCYWGTLSSGSGDLALAAVAAALCNTDPSKTPSPHLCSAHTDAASCTAALCTWSTAPPTTYQLTVNKVGTGDGFIVVSPPGISPISYPYTNSYTDGTIVNITATSDSGSTFIGWSGGCTGSGDCRVTMTSDKTVTVNFTDTTPPRINVTVSPANPLTGKTVIITAAASDNIAVHHGNIYFDGVNVITSGVFNTPTATFSYTSSALSVGQHNYSADAGDMAGNWNQTAMKFFNVSEGGTKGIGESCSENAECKTSLTCVSNVCKDTVLPVFVNVALLPETPIAGEPVAITANVSDNYALKTIDFYIDNKLIWDTCSRAQHKTPPELNIFNKTTGTCTNTMEYENESPVNLDAGTHNYRIVVSDMQPNYAFYPGPTGSQVKNFMVIPPPPITLTIEPISQRGENGTTLNYVAKIQNNRGEDRTFTLNITCPSFTGWKCTPNSTDIGIRDGDTQSISLLVKSSSNATLGNKSLKAFAYDKDLPEFNATVQFNYTVAICARVFPDLSVTPSKFKGPAGGEAYFTITVMNRDDCIGYFNYSAECPHDWNCTLSEKNSTIDIDAEDNITLTVDPAADADLDSYYVNFTATNLKSTTKAETETINYTIIACTDADKDGYYAEGGDCGLKDCNNADPTIHPHAQEFCMDSTDRNCNGVIGSKEQGCNRNQSAFDQLVGRSSTPSLSKEETTTPKCGNDIVETNEDCDGSNDVQCPGLCVSCTCPFIVGDDTCDTSAGESSANSEDCKKKLGGTGIAAVAIGILGALAGGTFYYWRRRGKFGGLAAAHGVETATPGVDLDTAVNSMMSEGYNPEEIHSNLEAGGWSHNKVSSAMESAQTDQEALGRLAEQQGVAAPTEKAKATRYVKKCMEQGYDPTQIRTALLSAGWPADAVDGVISKQTAKHIQTHAKKEGVLEPESAHKEDLGDYVKKELSEGHTKQSIKKTLKDAGWRSSDINEAFKE